MKDDMDLYDVAIRRIHQLEELNATLAAQVDRMRPVVEAAQADSSNSYKYRARLKRVVALYDTAMVQPTKGEWNGTQPL
jgi:hypothetical protein